jgi:hypothetical protein
LDMVDWKKRGSFGRAFEVIAFRYVLIRSLHHCIRGLGVITQ